MFLKSEYLNVIVLTVQSIYYYYILFLLHKSFLMLSTAQTVSASCPLVMTPSSVVVQYGDAFTVECNSTTDQKEGMGWESNYKGTGLIEADHVQLNSEKVDRWAIQSQCYVNLNNGTQCSEYLPITVYKMPDSVSILHENTKQPLVEHQDYGFECAVANVAPVKKVLVTWIKDNNSTVKECLTEESNEKPGNCRSDFTLSAQKTDNGGTLMCEAKFDFGPMGPNLQPIRSPVMDLQVLCKYFDHVSKFSSDPSELVQEFGASTSVNCTTTADGHRGLYWTYGSEKQDNVMNSFTELQIPKRPTNVTVQSKGIKGNQIELKCDVRDVAVVQNLTATWYINNNTVVNTTTFLPRGANLPMSVSNSLKWTVQGAATFTCEASESGPLGPRFVSSDTWKICCPITVAPAEILVKFGDPTSANCSTTEADADGIGWEATTGGIGLTSSARLEWMVKEVKAWDIKATCFINLQNGTQCNKPLIITVWKSPDEMRVSSKDSDSMVEGKPHRLICDVINVAPAEKVQVTWYQDELNATLDNVTSSWELIPKKDQNGANFTCKAELLLGQEHNQTTESKPYTANVQYKPRADCPTKYMGRENDLHLDMVPCNADGNPPPDIYWYYKDKPVISTEPLTRSDSGTYTAEFKNNMGKTSATVDIIVEYGPLFSCKDHYNVTENVKIGSECEPEGIPKPKSVLFKDGKEIDLPKIWKRLDSGLYSMIATNKHGRANHTLNITVLYIAGFSEEAITQEFTLGENVTLDCSADGNPPPQLHWKNPQAANVHVNTRGRQSYVHVTEATSSNAGLYSCTATNEVGTVSKNVTLMITGKTRPVHYILISISIIALFVLLIFICILIYRNYRKKSGHYDVIGLSDSLPLTPRL
uniref:Ig-like domain-containing protein n=1 Tax=Neogobius melanostomus TaxID=47308 RepID=A0A8C6U252_9GOBI